jgi:hypothetical protein
MEKGYDVETMGRNTPFGCCEKQESGNIRQ